jgi:hypothetical protein
VRTTTAMKTPLGLEIPRTIPRLVLLFLACWLFAAPASRGQEPSSAPVLSPSGGEPSAPAARPLERPKTTAEIFDQFLARQASAPAPVLPVLVALSPDLHSFRAFADGGWDGNWYVGFNTCWIVKLPPAPAGSYARAFIGARLGRAKTRPRPGGAPWDRDPIPGKIDIAISSIPAFPPAQSFFLVDTSDIPREPDYENPSLGVGHGEWFWTEIPVKLVNFEGPNYLAVWSITESLVSTSSAPILGAALDTKPAKEPRAWLNSSIQGVPPRELGAPVGVPVSFYLPSLVIKLVPANGARVLVRAFSASPVDGGLDVRFSVNGENVAMGWVEASADGQGWERVSGLLHDPPFSFTIPTARFGKAYAQSGTLFLRGAAEDVLGTLGQGEPVQMSFPFSK